MERSEAHDPRTTLAVLTVFLAHLRNGDWLTRPRVRLLAITLLALEIGIFAFLIAGTHGWIVPQTAPTTTDFVSFYAAGGLVDAGAPQLAYDHATHFAAEEAIAGHGIEYQFFNYPPVFLLLCGVLAHLPYLVSFVAFEIVTLLLYLFVCRNILDDMSGTTLLVILSLPIVFWNIGLGQNAFLTAALFGMATLVVDRRPIIAGVCFGALCYKPHFGLLVPLALAGSARWACLSAAAASMCALVLASIALFGWNTWHNFLVTAGASHEMYESGRILFGGFVSPFGAVRLLGGNIPVAYTIQACATVVTSGVVIVVWRCGLSLPTRAAVLVAGTLLAVPLALIYDLMLAGIAVCWLLRADGEATLAGWERTALAGLFVVLLDPRNLAEWFHIPFSFLVALGVFSVAVRRAVGELTRQSQPDSRRLVSLRAMVRRASGNKVPTS